MSRCYIRVHTTGCWPQARGSLAHRPGREQSARAGWPRGAAPAPSQAGSVPSSAAALPAADFGLRSREQCCANARHARRNAGCRALRGGSASEFFHKKKIRRQPHRHGSQHRPNDSRSSELQACRRYRLDRALLASPKDGSRPCRVAIDRDESKDSCPRVDGSFSARVLKLPVLLRRRMQPSNALLGVLLGFGVDHALQLLHKLEPERVCDAVEPG